MRHIFIPTGQENKYNSAMNTFAEWLQTEVRKRGLTQTELAESLGMTVGHVNKVYHGSRLPSPEMLHGLAKVFAYPPEAVFRAAGLLPNKRPLTDRQEQLLHVFGRLDDQGQQEALEIVKALEKAKRK